ncbi:MAG: alpha/beta fold hydrolase [Spirochaetes bacterium]|nr:alpha/beta fold hydrolase [Spirochaetota bacterium]
MNKCLTSIILLTLLITICCSNKSSKKIDSSFSFKEINNAQNIEVSAPDYINAVDKTKLAYYIFKPKSKPNSILLFLHGGGAHSLAGYEHIAKYLQDNYNILICLSDIRGHGKSKGPRGDSPNIEQVWRDVKTFIEFFKKKYPDKKIYLGGHSSGCGLMLNYITWNEKIDVDGYFFVSPEFGYKSCTAKKNIKKPFAKVRLWVFIISSITNGKLFDNTKAVFFNYPKKILEKDPLIIKAITRNMSVALTPDNPINQFKSIDKPFGLLIGEKDELFDVKEVIKYSLLPKEEIRNKSVNKVIKECTHLSIILKAGKFIGDTINNWNK